MRHFAIVALAALNLGIVKPNLTNIAVDYPMTLYHLNGKPVKFVVCDRAMFKPLTRALVCLSELKEPVRVVFHGCYNHRNIAGTNRLSQHAFGRAIDLNAGIEVPARMVKCFEDNGFIWGGRWAAPKTDPMHFQLRY